MNPLSKKLYSAMPTPFDSFGQVSEPALASLVEHNIAMGIDGLYVTGSTGEAFLLSTEERKQVMRVVSEVNNGALSLIAHIGSINTSECQSLAQFAEQCSYDSISAIPPFYYGFGFEEIKNHYQAVINSVDQLPMIIYNFPANSGVTMTDNQLSQLICLDKVIGIKQTSSDLHQLERLCARHQDKTIFSGFDELFLPSQLYGAKGGIGSTYNIMGGTYKQILMLINENKTNEALLLQAKANRVIDNLIEVGVIPGIKYLLGKMGVDCGNCRAPFLPLHKSEMKIMDATFELLPSDV